MTTHPLSEDTRHKLLEAAQAVAQNAYVPYSDYRVGAALLGTNGIIYTGCNVENAAYPATICAERTALVKAVSEGQKEFIAIAVVTQNGGSPCGLCRQMLFEFAPGLQVITADQDLQVTIDAPLNELLPHGFGPSSLE
ncbi:MAG: cytidine deaminase [Anaerolineaceae bacterium]|nr:cytidine deaminase [Anaerolineaceae bacterium]